jgi:hypothetical protein
MSWRDKLLLKITGSTVVIKIMSIPIVVKMPTVETRAFLWAASLFSRKKEEAQPDRSHPFDPSVYRLPVS